MTCAAQAEAISLLLVEEFAHRVLNEYMLAIASLNLAARGAEDPAVRRQLDEVTDRLYAHADAHRALAQPAPGARCDIDEYMAGVCSALAKTVQSRAGLRLNLEVNGAILPADRAWRLALIVSELVHNAARHGGQFGEILVELSTGDSLLACRVSNAGACADAPKLGRGRRVVLALARELDGWADWLFTPIGACASVTVPLVGSPAPPLDRT